MRVRVTPRAHRVWPPSRRARQRPRPKPRRPQHKRTEPADVPGENRLTLDATLAQRDDLRYTPAGIPAIDCTLHHQSVQAEAGGEGKVEGEVKAGAFRCVR